MLQEVDLEPKTLKEAYHMFLASEMFDDIRQQVFETDGNRCIFCGCTEHLEPHHISYEKWDDPEMIVTLDRKCHEIVTSAVDEAKNLRVAVPAFDVNPIYTKEHQLQLIQSYIENATRKKEAEIIASALYRIWVRSLDKDAKLIKIRQFDVMKRIAWVVIASIICQANRTGFTLDPGYKLLTVDKTMQHMARSYNENVIGKGRSKYAFMKFYEISDQCMKKVQERAKKLLEDGDGDSGT